MGRVARAMLAMAATGAVLAAPAVAQEPPPPAPGGDAAPAAEAPASAPAPVIAAFRAPRAVRYGTPVPVVGRVAPAAPTRVAIERRQGAGWVTARVVRSDASGAFRLQLPLRRSTGLRARALGAAGAGPPGPARGVAVRRRAVVSVAAAEYESIAGRPFTVAGAVVPARDGEVALLEGSRDGRPFAPLARLPVRGGRVAGTVTPTAGGRWRFRLAAPGQGGGADRAVSAATAPRAVHAANPHGVPRDAPVFVVQKISEAQLYLYQRGRLVRVLPVVFGKPSTPTPLGRFRVYSKTVGPGPAFGPLAIWYHGNYGIHGTNQEHLLRRSWRYYSKGCTRNLNANIRWLWDRVPVGTPVLNVA